jgi:redox-sensing transcriptional repressor
MSTQIYSPKREGKISPAVIKRLPRYRSYLSDLHNKGVERVSSDTLSEFMGYTASQIRQDLNNFGGFGQQGYGYNVEQLNNEIAKILGLDKTYHMIIVGAGNLGRAIANYISVYRREFHVDALFDIAPEIIGTHVNGIPIIGDADLRRYMSDNVVDIGVITTSKRSAQEVVNTMIEGGVRGLWNFASIDVEVPDTVALRTVHLSDSLHQLVYYVNNKAKEKE